MMKKIYLSSSLAMMLQFPAMAAEHAYSLAAVCDFSYARLYDAAGRISNEAGNKPEVVKLLPAAENGLVRYRMKNDEMSIDFISDGNQKKIMALEIYPNGLLPEDKLKNNLLSRLGVKPGYKLNIFEAGCDALALKVVFDKNKLKYVQVHGIE